MQSSRVLGIGFLLLIVAGLALWLSGAADAPPAPTAPVGAAAETGEAAPAAGSVTSAGVKPATATTAGGATDERVAVPASAQLDDKRPSLVGRVVGADGAPIAGATIFAAPGIGFANANGQLDFDTFDFSDFADVEDMDPSRMMTVVREQLADRVEVKTDADGRFRVQAKGASRGVGLRVLARGHAILDRRFTRPTEQDLDVGTLTLPAGAIIAGRVLEPDGAPVAGALVSRVHEAEARMMGGMDIDLPEMGEVEALRGGETATTDKAGRFELPHLLPGELVLRARHADHPTARSASLAVEAGRELRDVVVTMQRGGEIRGVVAGLPADAKGFVVLASKKPRADADPTGMMAMLGGDMADMLADMGMSFGERKAEIGDGGAFVLRGLSIETYRVWVGRTTVGFAGNGICSNRVEAMPGGNVELRFEPGISVTLTAVDAKTGAPIERLWVGDRLRGGGGMMDMMAAMPQSRRLGQYPGGVVTVANVRPKPKQTLTLSLAAIGYADWERSDLTLPASGALDLGTIKLEPAPVVAVTVLDADDSRPLAGATVRVTRAGGSDRGNPLARMMPFAGNGGAAGPTSGKSDREGRCTLNRPVEGAVVIEIETKDHAPFVSESIAVSADGPTNYTARLAKGGSVQVTVVDAKEVPLKDVVVEHKSVQGETATRKTDARGLVAFDRLAPGAHSFRLGKAGGPMAALMNLGRDGADRGEPWQSCDVQDRAQATLRLVKKPTASLRGVVRENGLPLAGARIAFREGEGASGDMQAEIMGEVLGAVGGGVSRTSKTGDDGVYTLAELPEGAHRLQVTHKGRAMPARLAVVLQNGENTFDIELDMSTVRGVVQDPQGNAVDGARIRIKKAQRDPGGEVGEQIGDQMETMIPGMNLGGGSTIKTDAAGMFELRGVDPDVELVIQATAKGFAPASTKVIVARGTSVDAKVLRLGAAGKIKVTVQTDNPFAVVVATFVGDSGGDPVTPVTQLLRKGKGTLDGLRPGTWQLTVQGMGRRGNGDDEDEGEKRTVEVVAGQTTDVQL